MVTGDKLGRDMMKPLGFEPMKQHILYDGSNRMVTVFEAPQTASNGAPALRTDYQYSGGSSRITDMKETLSTWDSAWDF